MSDLELQDALNYFTQLSASLPVAYASRISSLIAEAERRGRSEISERVRPATMVK
jgi:hypothetical protein